VSKILIVDDAALELVKLRSILEKAGHQVDCARDGAKALERMHKDIPEMVFMDIVMPVMDGFRATRMIRDEPKFAGVPVVLVSTRSSSPDRDLALQQGAVGLIGKPYTAAEILDALRVHLEAKRTSASKNQV
jgi:CheY-like chemotaxis protein